MRPISVLFTNNALNQRGGSETYVRDVALALLRRGHRPAVFSLVHGEVAAELRRATIPVLDDVTRLGEAPDVIHGHHHLETLIATLAFPDTPVVNFCHGWLPWEEMPLHHPAVRRYVAVDEVCVDRLVREEGLAPGQVELFLNFVDLDRFRPRPPLPARPARALIMSNAATADGYARAIRVACEAEGIAVDVVGAAAGTPSTAPEGVLGDYDLVFAKGRTALESLAVGCATVLADAAGAGPLVTPDNYDVLRVRNFGIRELRQRHDAGWYRGQIAAYRASGAAEVSARVRGEAALDPAITRLLEIYATAMATPPGPGDPSRAAAVHCSRIALPLKQAHQLSVSVQQLTGALGQAGADLEARLHAADQQRIAALAVHEHDAALLAEAAGRYQEMREAERESAAAARALQTRVDTLLSDAARREQECRDAELTHADILRVRQARIDALTGDATRRDREKREIEQQRAAALDQVRALQTEVAEFRALPTLRLRDAVLRAPIVGSILRQAARRLAGRQRRDSGSGAGSPRQV